MVLVPGPDLKGSKDRTRPDPTALPKVLNWIEVRRLRRPHHDFKTLVIEPVLSLLAGVLGVIILLKDHLLYLCAPMLKAEL